MQVLVPEIEEEALLDFPKIEGHVAPVQVEAHVESDLVHILPR